MATRLIRRKREAFLDNSGNLLASGYLKYYRAGTTTALTTYSDADGLVANTTTTISDHPELGAIIQLNSSGFTDEAIWIDSSYDAKELIYTSAVVLIGTWDNIPAGEADTVAATYSKPETPWTSISTSTSPASSDAGKAYAATPGAATLTVTLPSAVDVGNGRGFVFQKIGIAGTLAFATSGGQYINSLSTYSFTTPGVVITLTSDGANWKLTTDYGAPLTLPCGRLTLTTGTPVLSSDVTAATTVYYTQYNGYTIPVWNGYYLEQMSFTSDLSLTLTAAATANGICDVFAARSSGSLVIGFGPMWSSATAGSSSRGTGAGTTELARNLGLWTNANSITLTNGANTYSIAANQATYLGSLYIDGTAGQVSCHTSWGQSRKWGVWNAYNRLPIRIQAGDSTASWSYTTATWRASNADSANCIYALTGLAEEWVEVGFGQLFGGNYVSASGTSKQQIGIGWNSTTAPSGLLGASDFRTSSATAMGFGPEGIAGYRNAGSFGLNQITCLENGNGSSLAAYNGTNSYMEMVASYMG